MEVPSEAMTNGTVSSGNGIPPKPRSNSNLVVIAYFVPLAVPALLLADTIAAWLRGTVRFDLLSFDAVLAGVSAVWLLAGAGYFFLAGRRRDFAEKVSTPLVSIYAVYLMLALFEAFLRTVGIAAAIPGVPQPFTKAVTTMDPALTPGVSGTKTFTTNRLGLRGPMPPKDGTVYRIVTIGGSTTICANLDDSEEWTHLTMEYLNASPNRRRVWLGNAAVSGRNTVNHIVLMQWLSGMLHADMAIFLVGVNDLGASLAFEGAPTQAALEQEAGFQGDLPPGTHWRSPYPLYKRLEIFQLGREAVRNIKQRFFQPPTLTLPDFVAYRQRRAESPVVPLPDLSTGLREYRSRILYLASECRDLGMRCLFLTQPTMWRDGLPSAEQRLLWMGYTGRMQKPKGYVSPGQLGRAMDMYNRVLLESCLQSGLECFDLAAQIPKDTSAFLDDMHFNEGGARLVARSLAQYLLSTPPFGEQGEPAGSPSSR